MSEVCGRSKHVNGVAVGLEARRKATAKKGTLHALAGVRPTVAASQVRRHAARHPDTTAKMGEGG